VRRPLPSGCSDERFEKASLLARTHRRTAPVGDMLASSSYPLASVRLFELQNFGDLPIGIIECFPKNIRCSFHGRELLEQ
jgi:hypothetical protein